MAIFSVGDVYTIFPPLPIDPRIRLDAIIWVHFITTLSFTEIPMFTLEEADRLLPTLLPIPLLGLTLCFESTPLLDLAPFLEFTLL